VGISGTTSTYNFESAPSITASTSAATITAGKPVTLTTSLVADSVPMSGQQVELWAKTYPATTFQQIGAATTNSVGVARLVQHPMKQTIYKWRVAADGFDSATSRTRTVNVRTRLTINVLDATLASGQPLILWGGTTPVHAAQVITLLRRTSSGAKQLATTTTRSDGTFLFQRKLTPGKQKLFTRIGSSRGNVAGTSPNVTVTAH
jgi:hypothetical protein